MPFPSVVGFSGNIARPSKTRAFVHYVAQAISGIDAPEPSVFDIEDFGPSLPAARSVTELDARALRLVEQIRKSDILVVGTPTYKGSYTDLFKHFFDLLDPADLRGKPIVLTATGGGDRHSLMVEHQLRPLFGFFEAFTLPTAIYASNKDFPEASSISPATQARVAQAAEEAQLLLGRPALLWSSNTNATRSAVKLPA